MKKHSHYSVTAAMLTLAAGATAAPPLPNEFDAPGDDLSPLFAYFGGVSAWGSNLSPQTIYSGGSLQIWANLQPDWAAFSGFAVGTFGTAAPQLAVDPAADTFSLTIQAPTNGQLSFYVIVREDDNNDGVIDVNTADDQWETASVLLDPGTHSYNFAFTDFMDIDAGIGNNVPNFTTTDRIAYILVFETHDSYTGGHIEEPVSFLVDHVGFYVGPQTAPNARPADIDGDGSVNVSDLLSLLAAWGGCSQCPEDINQDGLVNVSDLLSLLSDWG